MTPDSVSFTHLHASGSTFIYVTGEIGELPFSETAYPGSLDYAHRDAVVCNASCVEVTTGNCPFKTLRAGVISGGSFVTIDSCTRGGSVNISADKRSWCERMQSVMDYANTFHAEFMVVNIDMPDCSEIESAMAFVQHKQAQLQQLFSMDGSTERVILINSGNCPSYVACTNGRIHYNTEEQKVAFLDSLSSHSYSYETTFCEAMEATFGTCIQRKENSAIATVKMPACAYSHIGSIDEYVDCSSNVQVNSVLYSKSTHEIKMRATSGPFHV